MFGVRLMCSAQFKDHTAVGVIGHYIMHPFYALGDKRKDALVTDSMYNNIATQVCKFLNHPLVLYTCLSVMERSKVLL